MAFKCLFTKIKLLNEVLPPTPAQAVSRFSWQTAAGKRKLCYHMTQFTFLIQWTHLQTRVLRGCGRAPVSFTTLQAVGPVHLPLPLERQLYDFQYILYINNVNLTFNHIDHSPFN